jgi:hypothetical protein
MELVLNLIKRTLKKEGRYISVWLLALSALSKEKPERAFKEALK